MENNIKSKIFTVIYAIVLIAAFIGAVQLLYNAIDMMTYTTFGEYNYGRLQKPRAIISLVAALFSLAGVASGVASLFVKGKTAQTVCHALIIAAAVILLISLTVSSIIWVTYLKENNSNYVKPPYNILGNKDFPLYSAVMAMLVPQFAYFVVLAALHIWDLVKSIKREKSVDQTEDKDGVATEEVK